MYQCHKFCLTCFSGLARFIMLKGHSIKSTFYFYFSVLSSNSRQCQACISKPAVMELKLKYSGKLWDTLAQCSQEVKFHLEQQLNIRTSHKPQRASQTSTELWNERQVCWKIFSTFLHVHYHLFCKEKERWSKYQTTNSVPRKASCFPPPFSVGK